VIRGFLGASTQDVTPLLGKLFKLPDVKGAIITDVMPKGSAEAAGLRRGDVIVRFDGKDIMDAGRLRNLIAGESIGSRHRVEFIRDGKREQTELVIHEAPKERARRTSLEQRPAPVHPLGGVLVDELTPSMARQLGLESDSGVVIAGIEEGSVAEGSGLAAGDVILEVNRQPVTNLAAYQRLVEQLKPTDIVLLLINRQGGKLYVPIGEE
jgi:serine protease Do